MEHFGILASALLAIGTLAGMLIKGLLDHHLREKDDALKAIELEEEIALLEIEIRKQSTDAIGELYSVKSKELGETTQIRIKARTERWSRKRFLEAAGEVKGAFAGKELSVHERYGYLLDKLKAKRDALREKVRTLRHWNLVI